jgi:deoxyribonuclease-4
MSIAGGFHKAVERAAEAGCGCVQVFTAAPGQWPSLKTSARSGVLGSKNNNQWRAKPLSDDDAARFREALARTGVGHPLVHDSYLINMASPDDALWQKSVEAFELELLRADKLGIPYVVAHPGSYTVSSEQEGLDRIVAALDLVHKQTAGINSHALLENTAGQGTNLGWRFEHLQYIIAKVAQPQRVGVCIDTCHTFAAGYPLATRDEYESTIAELDRVVGLARVKAIHLNDSKQGLGSRVDRHEHIGRGQLGLEPFRMLLNDPRFASVPMYLETAKEQEDGEEMDVVNLRTLRGLLAP